MKKKHTQKPTARISFRLWPEQVRAVKAAMEVVPGGWRGAAFFAREAFVTWAGNVVADAPRLRRAMKTERAS